MKLQYKHVLVFYCNLKYNLYCLVDIIEKKKIRMYFIYYKLYHDTC